MMSLQTSTHSSQMKTVGPAISLRTSFWSLLQNEQRRTSDSAVLLHALRQFALAGVITWSTIPYAFAWAASMMKSRSASVAMLLEGLLGVEGQDLVEAVLDAQDLLGLDGDVGGLALGAAPGLVDQDAGVGQGEALAVGARGEQHGAHARPPGPTQIVCTSGRTSCIVS